MILEGGRVTPLLYLVWRVNLEEYGYSASQTSLKRFKRGAQKRMCAMLPVGRFRIVIA